MNKVTVSYGQTWLDIAMQELGDIERVIELAQLNNKSFTDILEAGKVMYVPDPDPSKSRIIRLFRTDANKPASGVTSATTSSTTGEGIEFWAIENDFIVF